MSYTPINWQNGDTITAEKLNKMDNGWSVGNTPLFNESVTTVDSSGVNMATFDYASPINHSTITVIFNNNEYTCSRIDAFGNYYYGGFSENGPDFSVYPFAIECNTGLNSNNIYTSTEGTYSVSVSANTIDISDNFSAAVGDVLEDVMGGSPLPFLCVSGNTTYTEMADAASSGKLLYFYTPSNVCHFISSFIGSPGNNNVNAVPEGVVGTESYGFDNNGKFTVYTV